MKRLFRLAVLVVGSACSAAYIGCYPSYDYTTENVPYGQTAPDGAVIVPNLSGGPLKLLAPTTTADTWARESVHLVRWSYPVAPIPQTAPETLVTYSINGGVDWELVPPEQVDALAQLARFQVPAAGGEAVKVRVQIGSYAVDTPEVKLSPSQKRNYKWTQVTQNAAFGPRDGVGGVFFHGKMWAIGGWNPSTYPITECTNDVWSSVDGANWTLEKPNTYLDKKNFDRNKDWEARHFGSYLVYNDKIYLVGGDPIQGEYQNDVWSSGDGKNWSRVTDDWGLTPTRMLHLSAVFREKMWVLGGQTFTDFGSIDIPGGSFSDVWTSTDGAKWSQVKTTGPMWTGRAIVGNHAVLNDRLWVISGGLYPDPLWPKGEYFGDAWSTSDGQTWQKEAEDPPFSARYYHSVATFDNRIWVFQGFNGAGNLDDNWYTADGKNWYPAGDANLPARHAGTVWVTSPTTMYWGAGNSFVDGGARWVADVWRVDVVP